MSDSEHYVPPPPPYEHSLQHDHKVTDEAQAPEVSKGGPFQEEEKDWKHSRALSDKTPKDDATHTLPIPKRAGAIRGPRPLPPRPEDARQLRQRRKYVSVADIKSYYARDDHEIVEPHDPVPSFHKVSQTVIHPGTSVHPPPIHYPYQSSYDTPRRNRVDQWPLSPYFPMEPCRETSLKRPSDMSSQSPPYSLPQNESRLSFNPSVAYSGSQANTQAAFATQREVATSLYSSAVSSHLRLDSATISGSRQPFVPPRPALWSTERLDKTLDVQSTSSPSSPTSSYTQKTRTYEQRWATSESDITRDVYHA